MGLDPIRNLTQDETLLNRSVAPTRLNMTISFRVLLTPVGQHYLAKWALKRRQPPGRYIISNLCHVEAFSLYRRSGPQAMQPYYDTTSWIV